MLVSRSLFALSAILLLSAVSLPAQDAAADSGAFVVRRARDTVAVERFTRTATKLEGTLTLRNPKRTSERYSAVIAPDATIPLIEVTTREGADTGSRGAKVVQRARVIFKEDSVAVDEMSGAGLMTRVFGTEAGAVPYLNLSFALLEQAVLRARAKADQSQLAFFNLGGGQTITARVTGVGRDSLTLDIGDVRYRLKVDQKGRVLGARIPDQNVVVDRM
jgi:hypothetical protein